MKRWPRLFEYREIPHFIGIRFHTCSGLTFLGRPSQLWVTSDNLSSMSTVYQYYFVFFPISSSEPVISARLRPPPHVPKSDSTILRMRPSRTWIDKTREIDITSFYRNKPVLSIWIFQFDKARILRCMVHVRTPVILPYCYELKNYCTNGFKESGLGKWGD
jgi:hypothetical protein